MILSVFGPDGVGKSTITRALANLGWCVFSGTGVASWPDQTWHQELTKAGIDETVIGDEDHLLEKIRRSHALAKDLEKKHQIVVIDSDPLFKTLMHNYARALPNTKKANQILRERYTLLKAIAHHEDKDARIYAYLQVSDTEDELGQAKILQERIQSRNVLAPFDPTSVEKSLSHLKACITIKDLLTNKKERVITITTNKPFDVQRFQDDVLALTD